jgi:hypothetical protein
MQSGLNVVNRTIQAVLPDGREVSLAVSTALLRDRDSNIIGGVETFRDLTELEILRREAEKDFIFEDMFSRNFRMRELFDVLPDIAEVVSRSHYGGEWYRKRAGCPGFTFFE